MSDGLPRDIDLEQFLLGSMLKSNENINVAAADITAAQLYDPMHGRIFDTMLALSAEGSAVTPELIASIMKRDPGLVECGGVDYLRAMMTASPSSAPVKDYCLTLGKFAVRREIVKLAEDMHHAAIEEHDPKPVSEDATARLLLLGRPGAKPVKTPYELAEETMRELEAMYRGIALPIVRTGLQPIDDEIGGFRAGELITIAARSGMGKSALMGGIARNTAFAGVPTIVFSLEMTRRQWNNRMVCDVDFDRNPEKPLWYSKVRNGKLSNDEFDRFAAAAQRLHKIPFEIRDEDDVTIEQITAIARAFKAKHPERTGIVFLDYFQIINPGDTRERSREQIVNRFARGAKSLAKLLEWPVVVGSQMNKLAAEEGRRPQASDVRESEGIFNESDIMLSPYREAYYVERRKPIGALPGGTEWLTWSNEMEPVRHRMDVISLKTRDGHSFDANLYCEIGANAVRSEKPSGTTLSTGEQQAQGLLV